MKKERFALPLISACILLAATTWGDLALNNTITNDPFRDITNRINGVVCILFTLITYLASGISAIVIIYAGLKYMGAQDAETTTDAKT